MKVELLCDEPKVLLGDGALSTLSRECDRLGVERALIVCTRRRVRDAEHLADILSVRAVGIFAESTPHVPASLAAHARHRCDELGADAVIALGGGTAIGVAKAIAAARPVRVIAIPTTYSGSETTDIYGITEGRDKRTRRSDRVRPSLVIYDPAMTRYLPRSVVVTSGFNAIAHCVEALWVVPEHTPSRQAAEVGLDTLFTALPRVVHGPEDTEARANALRGAYFAGRALEGGVALHHRLCHLLGGAFGMPHAETHTVLLPQVALYNADAAPRAQATVRRILGDPGPAPSALFDLVTRLGGPTALGPLGFPAEAVDQAASLAARFDAASNPAPLEQSALRDLLERARRGVRPPG
jgi:maleylacetate reductase